MDETQILPALPASDSKSLERNSRDGYYDVKSRDFWEGAQIIRVEDKAPGVCEHYFESDPVKREAVCRKCHFGIFGQLDIRDGKLFYHGEPIRI